MKKFIWLYGLIAGLLCSVGYLTMGDDMDMDKSMVYGFASMILAFSLIFVATYQYKKRNGGITFGKAFMIGLYISLIASSIYVGLWLITYYNFRPDFMDKYSACVIDQLKASGKSPAEIQAGIDEMNQMKESYKNPLYVIATTYMEIFPLGIVVSLINGGIVAFKNYLRKRKATTL